ncbi:MAG: hypothetical protein K0R67_3118 [Paenibacillus sp.]|nr:hypothetical protein [Paenibacillus sp.]
MQSNKDLTGLVSRSGLLLLLALCGFLHDRTGGIHMNRA